MRRGDNPHFSKWLVLVALLALLGVVACARCDNAPLPATLYGTWKTEDPRYTGCYLEISEKLLIFHGIDGGLDINHIGKIKKDKGHPLQLDIHYTDKAGQAHRLKVFFDDSPGGPRLRLQTPKTLDWTRRHPHGH